MPLPSHSVMAGSAQNRSPWGEVAWRLQKRVTHIAMAAEEAHLVVPEGGEDEIHLDEDRAEGQQAAHERNDAGAQVPLALRDGRRYPLHSARIVWQPVPVAPYHLRNGTSIFTPCDRAGRCCKMQPCFGVVLRCAARSIYSLASSYVW